MNPMIEKLVSFSGYLLTITGLVYVIDQFLFF